MIAELLKHALDGTLEILYPSRCAVCTARTSELIFCADCEEQLTYYKAFSQAGCQICNEETPLGLNLCSACLLFPESYRQVRSLFPYEAAATALVKHFKYAYQPQLARILASLCTEAIVTPGTWATKDHTVPWWDIVIGLPSTRASDIRRGYRHTCFLARAIGRKLQIDSPIHALTRLGNCVPQASLKAEQRRINVESSFRADPSTISQASVLLIDDMLTSGSSIAEASRALKSAGAESVDVFTLCRSRSFLKNRLLSYSASSLAALTVTNN